MAISFPDPALLAARNDKISLDDPHRHLSIMASLLCFQADTIDAVADYLIGEAREMELANRTITFEQLKRLGIALRGHAQKIAPSSEKDREAVAFRLPLNDSTEYEVAQKDVDYWSQMFPAIDVMQKLRNMHTWLDANPGNRKTRRGVRAFIARWLAEEQDKAPRLVPAQAVSCRGPAEPVLVWDLPPIGKSQLAESIWRDMLGAFKVQKHTFDTWLKPTLAAGIAETTLYVKVPTKEFLHLGTKFAEEIKATMPTGITAVTFIAPREIA